MKCLKQGIELFIEFNHKTIINTLKLQCYVYHAERICPHPLYVLYLCMCLFVCVHGVCALYVLMDGLDRACHMSSVCCSDSV